MTGFTNMIIGGAMIIAVGTGLIRAVIPAPPFTIHSLVFDTRTQVITQDRTITTKQPALSLIWTGTVEDARGDSIRRCEGSGVNGYPPGRKAVRFTLEEWTGKPDCTWASLPPGQYRLRGSWRGGEISVGATSPVFEKVE